MYKYKIRTDNLCTEENHKYTAYGITVTDCNNKLLKTIPDLFYNKSKAQKFIDGCNSGRILFDYLQYIVEEEILANC